MKNENVINTHCAAAVIAEMFDDVLCKYGLMVRSPEDNERDIDNNSAALYGSSYAELTEEIENYLIELLEMKNDNTKIVIGVFE